MKFAETLCERTGFTYDPSVNLYYLEKDGFEYAMSFYGSQFYLMSCVCLDTQAPDAKTIKADVKGIKAIKDVSCEGYRTVYIIKPGMTSKKLLENIVQAFAFVSGYYLEKGYRNCCEYCGKVMDTGIYMLGNSARFLCEEDYRSLSQKMLDAAVEIDEMEGSLLAGSVGAFIGSLIGVVAIVLFGQLGFVSVLSGVIMGICAIRGYEIMGKKLTTAGVIVSCLIMAAMCYFANRLDWAITIARALEWDLIDAFLQCEYVCKVSDVLGSYWLSFGQVLLFTLLGALPQAMNGLRSRKNMMKTSVIKAAKKGEEE